MLRVRPVTLVTDAQRDSRKAWTYLERLFDWAGTRSKPMPASDLVIIRDQVTEALNRLVDRADSLERTPLLREVLTDDDGTKTVVIDMRDGTTRRFQTRVDWLDGAGAHIRENQITNLRELLSTAEDELSVARGESFTMAEERIRAEERISLLIEERDKWKLRWELASKVIDESLPAITEILAERTDELNKLREELDSLSG